VSAGNEIMRWVVENFMSARKIDISSHGGDLDSPGTARDKVQEFLADKLRGRSVRIYEAGGGSISIIPMPSLSNPTITVVDIDETQLRNNDYANTKILGDIQTYVFPPNSFDLIVCYNVIEHLPSVDQAIRQFHHALAPGGLLFVGAPNPASFYGIVTKYTPHWFHVWVYRVILRHKNAGKPGQLPFRTVYHPIVYPKALLPFCAQLGLRAIYFNLYIGSNYTSVRQSRPVIGWILNAVVSTMNALTFGRLKLAHGDYHVIFEKPLVSITP
jgi:SAM-dependent methyltransferase